MIRGCAQVKDDLRPALTRFQDGGPERPPDVFADGDSHIYPAAGKDQPVIAAPEVAFFVENPVVGKEDFVINSADAAAVDDRRGVVDFTFLKVDKPHHYRQIEIPGVCRKLGQGPAVRLEKAGFEQQVLRRIAGDCEFRETDQVGCCSCSTLY